jgi:hypothetical protein
MAIMRRMLLFSMIVPLAILAACGQQGSVSEEAKAATPPASSARPVIVELFQSQGCSSCPPANTALNSIADRSDVIALNFSVTYWDRLGWKDIFGDPAYTQRQYDYARTLGNENVATPQVVLNGTRAITGNRPGELNRAIAATPPPSNEPSISGDGAQANIGAGKGSATVWLVRYDPRVQNVAVRAGENGGRTLPHKNIVRELSRLGSWNGKAANYPLPKAKLSGLKSVIIVQSNNGPILAGQKI